MEPSSPLDAVQRAAQEQFARQSGRYGSGHILENVDDVRAALNHVALPQRARVLDVATGGGHTGILLASLGHDVTLADIALPMLEKASARAAQMGLKVHIRQHPAEQFPYEDGAFDLVTCRVAPHHFSSPKRFVSESARVLKLGGYFLLIDGTAPDDAPEAEAWTHAVEKLRDPSHNRFLTPQTWRELMAHASLDVIHESVQPFKQPDLEWYFETAATPPQNRECVLKLVHGAPASARELFRIGEEDGKITWWWMRLTLVARKE